jgi:hypothetical protein
MQHDSRRTSASQERCLRLQCSCGKVQLKVHGAHIASAECHCTSCRNAGARLRAEAATTTFLEPNGGTRYVLHRKDRVHLLTDPSLLRQFRLSETAKTRRVITDCCHTPVFMELRGGHWLSLYASLWPADVRPPIELRTMVSDLADRSFLPDDVPNCAYQSLGFYARLLGAWIAMGLRVPAVPVFAELEPRSSRAAEPTPAQN